MPKNENRTVWTSQGGDLRKKESGARRVISLPPHQQTAYLHRDAKGRGGTIKDDAIEIQGEHREKIAEALSNMGYKVKIAGG